MKISEERSLARAAEAAVLKYLVEIRA